jgi:hypothetical protein
LERVLRCCYHFQLLLLRYHPLSWYWTTSETSRQWTNLRRAISQLAMFDGEISD